MKPYKLFLLPIFLFSLVITAQEKGSALKIDFETFTLENGLKVIFHVDRSDPVVAVSLTSHVGSARETEGRTGFAHLFEHLLFLESENLGPGGLDKLSARIGGSGANGSTSRDRTNYLQTVPNDALEKMIWAEADKLGYFINTVTDPVLAKEKQVVKNEKRQAVDNRPYGHTQYVIDQNLYPEGHPYSWQVIGSLEDLQNATLQDVKDFFNRWYVPNNVILTVAGDFDTAQAKDWINKYFGEIAHGEEIKSIPKQPAVLKETKSLYYEDNFAKLPELTLTWASVPSYHEDSYALEILTKYLADGKNAPLYKNLVAEKGLTDNVRMYNYTSEIAGQLMMQVRAYDQKNLDEVKKAIDETLSRFEKEGIPERDLRRIKAGQETDFYNGISSVLGKGVQLTQYEMFAGDANEINRNVGRIMAVTAADVKRVFDKYIKGKHYVATSFVPKGQKALALSNSTEAQVVEEQIVEGAEDEIVIEGPVTYDRTPSSFDRTVEPPYWGTPEVKTPQIWKTSMPSGLKVLGITESEVPLIRFSLEMEGGLLLEDPKKIGVSNLLASLMTKGTKKRSPEELEEAIELLGSSISVYAQDEKIVLTGNSLSRNFDATMDLVREILLEPRWDEEEFKIARQQVLSQIKQIKANPNSIAAIEFRKLIYGPNHILSNDNLGTEKSVESITMQDLKDYYNRNLSPLKAQFLAVGDLEMDKAVGSLKAISAGWAPKTVNIPGFPEPKTPEKAAVYFYDVPGAKQSVIKIGAPALAANHEDYYSAEVMNYRLGGGGFASQLTQELREGKGYTYGIRSGFEGSRITGPFAVTSGVRSNITFEAVALIRDIMANYPESLQPNDLEVTQGFMTKSNARRFETLGAKLGMLRDINEYDLPDDYIKQREVLVSNLSVENLQELAKKYIAPDKMIYLVVGDAATQLDKLENLGFGKPVLLNAE